MSHLAEESLHPEPEHRDLPSKTKELVERVLFSAYAEHLRASFTDKKGQVNVDELSEEIASQIKDYEEYLKKLPPKAQREHTKQLLELEKQLKKETTAREYLRNQVEVAMDERDLEDYLVIAYTQEVKRLDRKLDSMSLGLRAQVVREKIEAFNFPKGKEGPLSDVQVIDFQTAELKRLEIDPNISQRKLANALVSAYTHELQEEEIKTKVEQFYTFDEDTQIKELERLGILQQIKKDLASPEIAHRRAMQRDKEAEKILDEYRLAGKLDSLVRNINKEKKEALLSDQRTLVINFIKSAFSQPSPKVGASTKSALSREIDAGLSPEGIYDRLFTSKKLKGVQKELLEGALKWHEEEVLLEDVYVEAATQEAMRARPFWKRKHPLGDREVQKIKETVEREIKTLSPTDRSQLVKQIKENQFKEAMLPVYQKAAESNPKLKDAGLIEAELDKDMEVFRNLGPEGQSRVIQNALQDSDALAKRVINRIEEESVLRPSSSKVSRTNPVKPNVVSEDYIPLPETHKSKATKRALPPKEYFSLGKEAKNKTLPPQFREEPITSVLTDLKKSQNIDPRRSLADELLADHRGGRELTFKEMAWVQKYHPDYFHGEIPDVDESPKEFLKKYGDFTPGRYRAFIQSSGKPFYEMDKKRHPEGTRKPK